MLLDGSSHCHQLDRCIQRQPTVFVFRTDILGDARLGKDCCNLAGGIHCLLLESYLWMRSHKDMTELHSMLSMRMRLLVSRRAALSTKTRVVDPILVFCSRLCQYRGFCTASPCSPSRLAWATNCSQSPTRILTLKGQEEGEHDSNSRTE